MRVPASLKRLCRRLLRAFRRPAGPDAPAFSRAADPLEPYCTEQVLHRRVQGHPLDSGEAKAIAKILARYGSQL